MAEQEKSWGELLRELDEWSAKMKEIDYKLMDHGFEHAKAFRRTCQVENERAVEDLLQRVREGGNG